MTAIVNNLKKIQQNIDIAAQKVGRQSEAVQIIAVTKQVSVTRAQEAIATNLVNLGENRPEGLLEKAEAIGNDAVWHYIGSLQTRKVKQVINAIDYLHSLDRMNLAQEIEKRAIAKVKCFVQVNVAEEEAKHGLTVASTMAFIEDLAQFEKIEVVGLMTMAPNTADAAIIRSTFKSLKKLQQEVSERNFKHAPCMEVSMGMSNDYEIAVEEGATFVRIGTALVGNEGSVAK
ncbi:YggS family pyridoxal phosphate-dependent enzyme [Kurthia sibirica]|uniref:Pyridoxal phosphate homeostasis protein n=1 Tax=Kurthia sibirica TaxID=202750 RepID=A0A2U3AQK9_9BACL|nr:YggS family pyridoxal phosphate-dependent enzyme [Kurthia sibirica]PWI26821.1 YggS family pyridoxal phosphate-dependent enzyme [Kurthia sibirica]GEK32642.1 YggS family pyridoxal phosphate enzyme [Kurthia sibirica]